MSNWGVFVACSESLRLGGAIVAFDTAGLTMLEDRRHIAVLWDLRVAAEARGQGVGTTLFRGGKMGRGAGSPKTQSRNTKHQRASVQVLCKARLRTGAIHRFAYPKFPNEAQLL